jgi:hypothetical protein
VRVYKSANVYNSILDWAAFVDDAIRVVEAAQRQDFSADPNQTVQAFIDLCARHEHNLYKFIHEVHTHDNGLFVQLMGWLEGILRFLKEGPRGRADGGEVGMLGTTVAQQPQQPPPQEAQQPVEQTQQFLHPNDPRPNGSTRSTTSAASAAAAAAVRARRKGAPSLDMNRLLLAAVDRGAVDERAVLREVNALIRWQMARKRWHLAKTRQKMAAEGGGGSGGDADEEGGPGVGALLGGAFHGSDFGLNEVRFTFAFPFCFSPSTFKQSPANLM